MSAPRGRGESGSGRGGSGGKPGRKPGTSLSGGKPAGRPGTGAGARPGGKPGGKPGGSPEGRTARGDNGAAKGGPPRGGARKGGAKPGAPKPPRVPVVPGAGGVGGKVPAAPEGPMRVQRALARAGVLSRREADQAVADGRVTINGAPATTGQSVDPSADRVTLDGKPVSLGVTTHRWIVLHKPAAIMTTSKDPEGRRTVFDLVERVPGLVYVGRLDFMTEGVLLLTTDGRAAHALTHPSNEVERTYVATVRGDAPGAVRAARRGVQLEDGLVVPREVSAEPLGNRRWSFEITIAEGRTHEVRRLCDALGLEVERLVRTRFGPVRLGDLAPGATRALTPKERDVLEALVPAR